MVLVIKLLFFLWILIAKHLLEFMCVNGEGFIRDGLIIALMLFELVDYMNTLHLCVLGCRNGVPFGSGVCISM